MARFFYLIYLSIYTAPYVNKGHHYIYDSTQCKPQ